MESLNFEFLRPRYSELADLGAFAELYAHSDPSSAGVKLRAFAELLTGAIYEAFRLQRPLEDDFVKLLTFPAFKSAVPAAVQNPLHAMRKEGNQAAHGSPLSPETALYLLEQAFKLAQWWSVRVLGADPARLSVFREPKKQLEAARLPPEAKMKLAAQEKELEEKVKALEELQQKYEQVTQQAEHLADLKNEGQQTADLLHLNENDTRQRLIDRDLARAGWKVGHKGTNTSEVTQEHTLKNGDRVDYVLWDDNGKPLAIVEAKKTARDTEAGRKQAAGYAEALEREHGQRPVIFTANGHDIHIWDDAQGYPPRPTFGFYSKDSLQYRIYQRSAKKPLANVTVDPAITNRLYQIEAIRRVSERFTGKNRKALLVQATGTGKTRVAISITDVLMRAGWVKRVLFLCDRTELRKQAKNAFSDFLKEPLAILDSATQHDRNARIYLATYPALDGFFQNFDPGYFDLLIADESHRSVYNHYRDLFRYFDCLQIGLTATPVEFIARNSFQMFECINQDPTFNYDLDDAVEQRYLVPHEVATHTTRFLREGIKYTQLSQEQRQQLEENGEDPTTYDYDAETVDKQIFNKDTNRLILRNLMESGIREATGQRIGKTIIFARGHRHAVLLHELFDEMYPQYGGSFCAVIDNQIDAREQLIDDFKNPNDNLTIAISVDMLDTGIDVPEIVNLVFAKPVRSKVKFWQMIGRGTRLCKDLFGPGKDKTTFRIFDHWGNFEYFDQPRAEVQPAQPRSLLQRLFEARIDLAETALQSANTGAFAIAKGLIASQIAALPDQAVSVREKWREVQTVAHPDALQQFSTATVGSLRRDVAPLMQWIDIAGYREAYELDLLLAQTETELVRGSMKVADCQAALIDRISQLKMNLNPVRERFTAIQQARSPEFWQTATVPALETVRTELRGIMQYRQWDPRTGEPRITDIAEELDGIVTSTHRGVSSANNMAVYRERVLSALRHLFTHDATLQKIRRGESVSTADLDTLTSLVLTQNPTVDLRTLKEFYPGTAGGLEDLIRSIAGMEADAVDERFAGFAGRHPLNATQTQFLAMLKREIAAHGAIEIDRLYDPPFTSVHSDGLDGIFGEEKQIQELLEIVRSFEPHAETATETTQV
jgi:type I restriction enzyme, R subunit